MAGATTVLELSCKTLTVVVEFMYFSTQNVVIHNENCKLEFYFILPFYCSTTQMEKNIRRMCDIEESNRRRDLQILLSKCFTLYKSDRPARLPSVCFSLFYNLALTSIPFIDRPLL